MCQSHLALGKLLALQEQSLLLLHLGESIALAVARQTVSWVTRTFAGTAEIFETGSDQTSMIPMGDGAPGAAGVITVG